MSIQRLTSDFLIKAKSLYERMRSSEGTTLSIADLEVIREQLRRLESEAAKLHDHKATLADRRSDGPGVPPRSVRMPFERQR